MNGFLNFGRPSHIPIPPAAFFGLNLARSVCGSLQMPLVTKICLSAIPEPPASK